MSDDIGTTERKPLTPTQRLRMFEAHKGICCICCKQIRSGEKWIDEHIRPLALGGSNEGGNRGPAHVACASDKTSADLARIAKAKAQKKASLGIKGPTKKIASAGFPKFEKPSRISRHRIDKSVFPKFPPKWSQP